MRLTALLLAFLALAAPAGAAVNQSQPPCQGEGCQTQSAPTEHECPSRKTPVS